MRVTEYLTDPVFYFSAVPRNPVVDHIPSRISAYDFVGQCSDVYEWILINLLSLQFDELHKAAFHLANDWDFPLNAAKCAQIPIGRPSPSL